MRTARIEVLPVSLPPFGVGRTKAAALFDISESLFDKLVSVGKMPQPRRIEGRLIWDVSELADAFRALPHKRGDLDVLSSSDNPWGWGEKPSKRRTKDKSLHSFASAMIHVPKSFRVGKISIARTGRWDAEPPLNPEAVNRLKRENQRHAPEEWIRTFESVTRVRRRVRPVVDYGSKL